MLSTYLLTRLDFLAGYKERRELFGKEGTEGGRKRKGECRS